MTYKISQPRTNSIMLRASWHWRHRHAHIIHLAALRGRTGIRIPDTYQVTPTSPPLRLRGWKDPIWVILVYVFSRLMHVVSFGPFFWSTAVPEVYCFAVSFKFDFPPTAREAHIALLHRCPLWCYHNHLSLICCSALLCLHGPCKRACMHMINTHGNLLPDLLVRSTLSQAYHLAYIYCKHTWQSVAWSSSLTGLCPAKHATIFSK